MRIRRCRLTGAAGGTLSAHGFPPHRPHGRSPPAPASGDQGRPEAGGGLRDVGRWTLDVGRWTLDVGRWNERTGYRLLTTGNVFRSIYQRPSTINRSRQQSTIP